MSKIIKNGKIKFNSEKVAPCRFKKLGNKYLVTNDIGRYFFLSPSMFKKYMEGRISENSKVYKDLEEKGFIRNSLNFEDLVSKYRQRNNFISQGPSLHIIVVTLRCNYKCIYCQASSVGMEEKGYDMDKKTAKKVVDMIFCTPSPTITIEFQGGEPLVNWPVVKYIIEYARKKKKKTGKNVMLSLVSNLSLLTEEKYNFLVKNQVSLCTSLDGPEKLHNRNRPCPGKNSYKETVSWIKKLIKRQKKDHTLFHLAALLTVSKFSLKYPREIIDEYLKLGFNRIHLRPLSFLGLSSREKSNVGYSVDEFLKFWKKSMDYIIDLNLKGKFFYERSSGIMLRKILSDIDPNFLDLRSPCGAGIGQMLYNYNGKIYTCDEGRMIGDDTFIIGDVNKNSYKEIMSHDTVKSMCVASLLDNLPCDNCAYKPYCGVCPVLNYALYGDIFTSLPSNEMCKLHKGMLDYLFRKLENKKIRSVFEKWVESKK
jgi:His-Xaa-Ser system radical SAM maturase HxsB